MTATGEFTHFDIPGICTHGPAPVPGQDLYGSTMITAAQLMEMSNENSTYCLHFGATRTIHPGWDLAAWAREPQYGPTLFINHLHEVPANTEQRTEDLWMRTVDPITGQISVDDHLESVWNTATLAGPTPAADHPLRDEARRLTAQAFNERREERNLTEEAALEEALQLAEDGAVNSLSREHQEFAPEDGTGPVLGREHFTLMRVKELIDRAYNRARIRIAGVDLDNLTVGHKFGDFFALGMAPPTHEEMADHIIRTHRSG